MRTGNWPDADVRHFDVVARFNGGPPVHVESMHLSHSMIDGHPSGHDGGLSTSGSITILTDAVATSITPDPWSRRDGFPPKSGTPVTIDLVDGEGQEWRRLTGITERAEGSYGSRVVKIPVRDHVDRLGALVSSEAVLETHPPALDGNDYRGTRVCAEWLLDRAMRAAGWFATPQMQWGRILSVPMVGSLWPEYGELRYGTDTGSGLPDRNWSDTHIGMHDVSASWDAAASTATPDLTTAILPQGAGDSMRVQVTSESGVGAYVRITSSSDIRYGTINGTTVTELGTIAKGAATRVGLRVTTTPGGTMGLKVRTDEGVQVTDTASDYSFGSLSFSRVSAYGPGNLGWIQLLPEHDPNWPLLLTDGWSATNARHRVGGDGIEQWIAAPQVWDTPAIDLISDWARATCGQAWIDMDGHLQLASRRSIDAIANSVLTLTSDRSLLDVDWVDDGMYVARQVRITYQHPKVQRSKYASWRVWQGVSQTLEGGDSDVTTMEIPDNEDWIDLDDEPHLVNTSTTGTDIRRNTVIGGMQIVDDSGSSATPAQYLGTHMIQDGPRAWEVRVDALHDGTSGPQQQVVTAIPDALMSIPRRYRGLPLPDVKARARVYRLERVTVADTVPGDGATVQLHEHHTGNWVQEQYRRALLRTYLIYQMGEQQPAPTDVSIAPDPRVELGDVVTLDDSHRTGVRVFMFTTQIDEDFTVGSGLSMSISGREAGWALLQSMTPTDTGHEPGWNMEAT